MTADRTSEIEAAELVLPCAELDETLAFFTARLGFRVDLIFPADDPSVAVISGHGVRIRLQRGGAGSPGTLRLLCRDPGTNEVLCAPNGTRIELVAADPPLQLPPAQPAFVLTRMRNGAWGTGRAGMRYRDLIPDRQGGRFIASHIQIPDGGPVPDYVHYHVNRFQMIYCYKGEVRVAYEDQGPPFTLRAGDCVLQPPRIRHRVLEASAGLEVIEIGCPAAHETRADHELLLPTATVRADRAFEGQRFVHHVAAEAATQAWRWNDFTCRDTGIAAATGGLAGVRVVRPDGAVATPPCQHDAELLFLFVLHGTAALRRAGHDAETIEAGDCVVVPAAMTHRLMECSQDLELLEVSLPAAFRSIEGALA